VVRVPPTDTELHEFYASYPTAYAQCRTWKHGPERPYTVERPNGRNGVIEVTRVCQCGRLVTRVFTAAYQRLPEQTRVVYPSNPRYLALPGTGGVDRDLIARRAIEGDIEQIEAATAARPAAARRGGRTGNGNGSTGRKRPRKS
jgi:hypothetical protein